MPEDIEIRRKRIYYRATHTGMKETDLMLGRFSRRYLSEMDHHLLDLLEALMDAGDPNIYAWISGRVPVPPEYDTELMARLKEFEVHSAG
ncbi:succinate dehydrogenase assembly factor 2 [Oceanibacterium hippocampi]|uniref:succinate dehydrogenase assembly factor 2 n=1 Tax=Oceanibacterium hippocampi TaxID=745714 RepID=UPI00111C61AC|nr:succinate dehydrogenase assembly factor 2 [Oceanibacterium hippocampi]